MKKVLFHSLTIPPDNISTGKLVAEIASKFFQTFFSVDKLGLSARGMESGKADSLLEIVMKGIGFFPI